MAHIKIYAGRFQLRYLERSVCSPQQRQIVFERSGVELRMGGHNLHPPLLVAVGFLLQCQIVLSQPEQQIGRGNTEIKRWYNITNRWYRASMLTKTKLTYLRSEPPWWPSSRWAARHRTCAGRLRFATAAVISAKATAQRLLSFRRRFGAPGTSSCHKLWINRENRIECYYIDGIDWSSKQAMKEWRILPRVGLPNEELVIVFHLNN